MWTRVHPLCYCAMGQAAMLYGVGTHHAHCVRTQGVANILSLKLLKFVLLFLNHATTTEPIWVKLGT